VRHTNSDTVEPSQPCRRTLFLSYDFLHALTVHAAPVEREYPERPRPRTGFSYNPADVVFIRGNEGFAIIEAVGAREPRLKVGDCVVMHRAQSGTWAQRQVVDRMDVIALNEEAREVGREAASMLMVSHRGLRRGYEPEVYVGEPYDCPWSTYGGRQAQEERVGHPEWGE